MMVKAMSLVLLRRPRVETLGAYARLKVVHTTSQPDFFESQSGTVFPKVTGPRRDTSFIRYACSNQSV